MVDSPQNFVEKTRDHPSCFALMGNLQQNLPFAYIIRGLSVHVMQAQVWVIKRPPLEQFGNEWLVVPVVGQKRLACGAGLPHFRRQIRKMLWGKRNKDKERFYLLAGMGGSGLRRKRRLYLICAIAAGMGGSAGVGVIFFLCNKTCISRLRRPGGFFLSAAVRPKKTGSPSHRPGM